MKRQKLWKRLCAGLLIATMIIPNVSGSVHAENSTEDSVQMISTTYETSTTSDGITSTEASYMTEDGYKSFGFNNLDDVNTMVDEDLNPLEGYQPQILNELYIGHLNHPDDYQGYFATAENAATISSDGLNLNTMQNSNVGGKIAYYDEDNLDTQCVNAIAVTPGNINEDGAEIREQILIEARLYLNPNGAKKADSGFRVQAYSLVNGKWEGGEAKTRCMNKKDGWVGDITIREQGGYNSMTTGDFDGDGYNEVAVFCPYSADSSGCIYIYQPVEQSDGTYDLTLETKYWISDLGSQFNWADGATRPLVSMTTTDMTGVDEIVLSVTLPYDKKDEACNNGIVAVIRCNDGNYEKIWWDSLVIGNDSARFKLQNVTNADLNGDGQDEIVIAGHKNTGYDNGDDRGDIDEDEMLINVLLYNGSDYYLAWSDEETPTVPRHPDLYVDNSENDPISMTAGRYFTTKYNDTVFCEGVFLHFNADENQSDSNKQIENGTFTHNEAENLVFSNTDESFVGTVATGCFVEDQRIVEQTVVMHGHNALGDDTCDVNITWFYGSTDKSGNAIMEQVESNNDYINDADEDDNGTCVVLTPVNADNDSVYIKYKARYYGYSNPAAVGVLISQPYWDGMDYGAASGGTRLGISHSDGTSTTHEGGVGIDFHFAFGGKGDVFHNTQSVGFDMNFAAAYAHSKTSGTTTTTSETYEAWGEDKVVLMVVPIVTYCYDMLQYKDGSLTTADIITINTSYTPAMTSLTVDEYNRVANEFNAQLENEDAKLTLIDLDEAFYEGYSAGDPSSYPNEVNDIAAINGGAEYKISPNWQDVNMAAINGSGSVSMGISEETSTTVTNGLTLSLALGGAGHFEFGATILGFGAGTYLDLSAHLTGSYGYTYAETDSDGNSYEGTLVYLPEDAITGEDEDGNPTSSYAYEARLVQWEQEQYVLGEAEDGEVKKQKIPYIGYIVRTAITPPQRVGDLVVSGTTKSSAKLTWTKPSDRISNGETISVDHYKIYMSTSINGEYKALQENGTDVVIDGGTTSYMVTGLESNTAYYFKIQSFTAEEDPSMLSKAARGKTLASGAPIITGHPSDMVIVLAPGNTWGNPYSFSVQATPYHSESTLSYQWEKLYNGSWVKIDGATESSYSTDTTYPEDDGLEVRCVVTETHTDGTKVSLASQSATLTVLEYGSTDTKEQTMLTVAFYPEGSGNDESPTYVSEECYQAVGETVDVFARLSVASGYNVNPNFTYAGKAYLYDTQTGTLVNGYPKDVTYDSNGFVQFEVEGLEKGIYYVVLTFDGDDRYTACTSGTAIIHMTEKVEINYELNGGVNHTANPTWCNDNWTDPIKFYAPTKEKATFCGWYLDAGFETSVPYNSTHSAYTLKPEDIEGDEITLYAKWEDVIEEYQVTYELNGGENAADNPSVIKMNEEFTLKEPTKAGYEFEGWYLDAEFAKTVTAVSGADGKDVTVYAKWSEPVEYSIQYIVGEGVNADTNPATYTIESEEVVFADPTFEGYEFGGWYTDADYTTQIISIPKGSTGDVTIYAKWTLIDTLEPNEEGVYEISSYDDLIEMAKMVKYNPEKYAGATYVQTRNITCGMKTWPLAIGSSVNPFEGTYEGNDYYILGLRPTNMVPGLFGVIGENGVVKNLSVIDFDYEEEARYASGLAGINYGTIDGCGSGVNLTSAATIFREGQTEAVPITTLDSEIKATEAAGGLVVFNEGTIKNSRNNAEVTIVADEDGIVDDESYAGGIAGENTGIILNVYQNGVITGSACAGGIAGVNSGSIQYGYNSSAVTGTTVGAIVGTSENTDIKDMFYDSVMENASGNQEDSVLGVTVMKADSMKTQEFADILTTLVEGTELRSWTYSATKNAGYPRIVADDAEEQIMVSINRGEIGTIAKPDDGNTGIPGGNTSGGSASSGTDSGINTGDNSNPLLFAVLLLASASCIVIVNKKKRGRGNE